MAGTARQRGCVGGDAVRRHQKHRAPGFLTRLHKENSRCVLSLECFCSSALLLVPAPSLLAQTRRRSIRPLGRDGPGAEHGGENRNRSGEEQQRRARRHVHATRTRRQGPSALDRCRRGPVGPLVLKAGPGGRHVRGRCSRPMASRSPAKLSQGGYSVPFSLTRTGDARIATVAKEPSRSARSWKAPGTARWTSADDRCGSS